MVKFRTYFFTSILMSKKLFVGNLSWGVSNESLAAKFAEFGAVDEAIVILNERGQSKGFGFVTYSDDSAADSAIAAMDGQDLDGRNIVVNEARPREERPRY